MSVAGSGVRAALAGLALAALALSALALAAVGGTAVTAAAASERSARHPVAVEPTQNSVAGHEAEVVLYWFGGIKTDYQTVQSDVAAYDADTADGTTTALGGVCGQLESDAANLATKSPLPISAIGGPYENAVDLWVSAGSLCSLGLKDGTQGRLDQADADLTSARRQIGQAALVIETLSLKARLTDGVTAPSLCGVLLQHCPSGGRGGR
jgi:hypothetical protein